jgi:hypothetical protein
VPQDKVDELNKKLRLSQHQLDQIKEEVTLHDALVVKQKMETARVEKERDFLKVCISLNWL